MNGIFGLLHRDGGAVAVHDLERLAQVMADVGGRSRISLQGAYGAGVISPRVAASQAPFFAAFGRIDNRDELCAALGTTVRDLGPDGDSELMRRAWERWGEEAPTRLFGDWSFAAWNAETRTLVLARDHCGNTVLYYYESPRVFAFASSRRALLALGLEPAKLDEFYLARILVSLSVRGDNSTVHAHLKRLPPAWLLRVTPERSELRQYWHLEDTPDVRLAGRAQYVEAFREIFDEAVRCRLPSDGQSSVASMLSGGLDSGSVATTAAYMLKQSGQRLAAFTAVPVYETSKFIDHDKFGDELPYARAAAEMAGNIDLHPVDSARFSPIQAMRRMLEMSLEPQHAAGNFFWMLEIFRLAAEQGNAVLFTGQLGNGGISWHGDPFSQAVSFRIRRLGVAEWLRENVRRHVLHLPIVRDIQLQRRRAGLQKNMETFSAIRLEYAQRIRLEERWITTIRATQKALSPKQKRGRMGLQGSSGLGAIYAEMGAATGIEMRDPTGDPRVLSFTFSVPDEIYIEPRSGMDRWLIREAMKDRLPDMVRLNRARARQAGDLVPRLRASAAEVEAELDAIERGPAAEYVDVPRMRRSWQAMQREDSYDSFVGAIGVLTRGLMAGMFINDFGRYS